MNQQATLNSEHRSPGGDTEVGLGRLEAFSDAVIAVAITLLALDIRVPHVEGGSSLAEALGEQWPSYVAYAVSFLTIGIIWVNHHALLRRCVAADHSILMLNLLLLMIVVVLPFTTALLADYLTQPDGAHLAAVVYGGSYLLMAMAFATLQTHLVARRPHLLHRRLTAKHRRKLLIRNAAGIAPYAAATLLGMLSPYLTLAVCAAIAVFYALPLGSAETPVNEEAADG